PNPRDGHIAVTTINNSLFVFGGWIGLSLPTNRATKCSSGQMKLTEALNSLDKRKAGTGLQSGLQLLYELEDTHFTDEFWEFDFGILSLYSLCVTLQQR